jgi:hypothetical protein
MAYFKRQRGMHDDIVEHSKHVLFANRFLPVRRKNTCLCDKDVSTARLPAMALRCVALLTLLYEFVWHLPLLHSLSLS